MRRLVPNVAAEAYFSEPFEDRIRFVQVTAAPMGA
jgi:hypothetical protein